MKNNIPGTLLHIAKDKLTDSKVCTFDYYLQSVRNSAPDYSLNEIEPVCQWLWTQKIVKRGNESLINLRLMRIKRKWK